ncbi:AAA family ATPase [uncultured Bilophila sp.]|uniref:AAA family ATPase n=1 Tax=uncultured Bilophila sp. TaxID=529385 RepID=UPI0025D2647C|nr:AAA family ATPase [uncultured Bilophila sp.]
MYSPLPHDTILYNIFYTMNHRHLFEDENWMKQFKNRSVQALVCPNMEEYFSFKNNLKLSLNSFSSKFMQHIGLSNIKNIYGIEFPINIKLFTGLTEWEAQRQFMEKRNEKLIKFIYNNDFCIRCNYTRNGIEWTDKYGNYGNSLVQLAQLILVNQSRLDTLATLANIVHLNIGNFYHFTSQSYPTDSDVSSWHNIPEVIPFHDDKIPVATCADRVPVRGYSGQVIGGFVQYRAGEHLLCLPATPVDGFLSIGKCKPTAFFLNQDEIDRNQSATVIFCADIRTAIALDKALKECRRNTGDFVVTGHLGTDLSILPWNYLYAHPVVFVPAPSTASFASVKAYREYISGASKERFSVASNLLLHTAPSCDLQSVADELDNVSEAKLLRTAVYINDIERPSIFLRNLANNARGYEEFVQWGKNAGIFAVPKQELSLPPKTTAAITFFDPDTVEENSQPTKLADVTAEHIFSGITMLHGPKNVGKSHVVLSAINSLITDNPLWGIFPVNSVSTKTLLVDSETTPKNFKERLEKYELKKEDCNFFSICKLASDQDVNLMDEMFQDTLLKTAKEKGITTIFFDNLTSLIPDGRIYNVSSVSGIFRYLEEMQKCNIVPILVHHSHDCPDNVPEKTTMRGTSEFSIRAHTEIVITSPENKGENSLPSSIFDTVNQGDFIVGIHFKVCKAARILEGKTFWLQMPLSATGFELTGIIDRDGKELPLSLLAGGDLAGSVVPSMETADKLSDEENRVLQEAGSQGKLRNAEVQNLLKCSDSKAGKILAGLVDKGLLKKQGEGRGCHYVKA